MKEINPKQQEKIITACRLIASSDTLPTLAELACQVALSPSYFHRLFKTIIGLTPKEYAEQERLKNLSQRLLEAKTVTEGLYAAKFGSSTRFYVKSEQLLGMSPKRLRKGGEGIPIYFAIAESSLGSVLIAQSAKGICSISIGNDPQVLLRALQDRFPRANLQGADQTFEVTVATILGLIERPSHPVNLPLDIQGTVFQQRVWQALQKIPCGQTATYAQIATALGKPKAARAVALACAANPLAVAIPCHRVIRQDGSLSGYRWGVEVKRELLKRESKG